MALLALCSLARAQATDPKTIGDGSAPGEQAKVAETVQLCDLLKNPLAYQHKLVRVRGLVVRVFSSGTYKDENGEEQEVGYGRYGLYSLFVLQRVEAVSRN